MAHSNAERQAAFRARKLALDRDSVETLVRAVEAAAQAGDPLAKAVQTGSVDALLRNLAHFFEERARNAAGRGEPPK